MTQPPPTDPDWVTMRAQHQQECAAFGRQVEAEMQAMRRRHGTENQNLTRRIEEIKAELLGRHKQQEGAYWHRQYQKQSKTSSPVPPPPPNQTAIPTSRRSAALASTPGQNPLPTQDLVGKQSSFKALDKHKQNGLGTATASATQQRAEQQIKQSSLSRRVQQQAKNEGSTGSIGGTQASKPAQTKPNAATSRSKPISKKDVETIDLYSSDDDMLVEVSKADYQKKTTPTAAPAPFHPAVPTATPQLFGETSQKQAVSSQPCFD